MFFLFRIISSQLFEVKASIFVYVGLFLCQRLFSLTLVHSSADKSNKLTNGFFFLKEERKKVIFSKVCLNQFFLFLPSAPKIRAHSFIIFASSLFTFFSCDERLYRLDFY